MMKLPVGTYTVHLTLSWNDKKWEEDFDIKIKENKYNLKELTLRNSKLGLEDYSPKSCMIDFGDFCF